MNISTVTTLFCGNNCLCTTVCCD